jgi:acetate kinase
MSGAVVVLNAGSSSIKFAAFACAARSWSLGERLLHGEIDGVGSASRLVAWDQDGAALHADGITDAGDTPQAQEDALRLLFEWLERQLGDRTLLAVGHRVVHGGEHFVAPVRIEADVLARLDALSPLAPLHQPHNLAAIRVIETLLPGLPQVASFDTAFHATQPWLAQAYALPAGLRDAGIRRYGFHGLSYDYIAGELPARLGALADARVVVAHLGNGASLCALRERRSVATTMGFTALDGLMMGTRCGSLDPGVVLYLQNAMGMSPGEVEHLLYQESGLLGVSGISADMRTLQASDDPRAEAAIALFVHRISRELGSLAAELGGLDALVFTAGIGEHAPIVRARVCAAARWLGVEIDAAANQADAPRIDAAASRVQVHIIPTDEERVLARNACAVMAAPPSPVRGR